MEDCVFCQIVAGKIPSTALYGDEDVTVIKDIHPQAPVHLLVIPKKHIVEFVDADEGLLSKMISVMKKVIHDEHVANYRLVNNGKGAAMIDHLHFHILGNVDKMRSL